MAGFTKHKYAKDLTQTKNSFNTYVVTAQPPPLYQSTGKREIICLGKHSNKLQWSTLEFLRKLQQVVT